MFHRRHIVVLMTALVCFPLRPCLAQVSAPEDSLRREILRLAVAASELEASRTDLWHRLIPRVTLSASLSAGDLVFAGRDAASYVLPKDAYRVSVGLDLSGLFDTAPHEKAIVDLRRRQSELLLEEARGMRAGRANRLLEAKHDSLRAIAAEELALRSEGVHYEKLLFEQGKAGYNDLLRARLAFLAARRSALESAFDPERTPEEK